MYNFDARQKLLLSQSDTMGLGLEIGPSYSPVAPKKSGLNVKIADYIGRQALREKYAAAEGVDIDRIEEVDYVLGPRTIGEVIEERACFDFIIASHVIEHMPDLLGFLQDCQALLKPGGVLSLAVPDKRACFDFLSPVTTTGEVLQANFRKDRMPTRRAVFDHEANRITLDGKIAWEYGSGGRVDLAGDIKHAKHMFDISQEEYIDVHVWRFVPSSFRLILSDLRELGMLNLHEKAFLTTSNFEFYVFLSSTAQSPRTDRKQLLLQSLAEQQQQQIKATDGRIEAIHEKR